MNENRRNIFYAACIFAGMFLYSMINSAQGVLLTPLINFYGLSKSTQGMASAAQNAGCMIALISSLWAVGREPKPRLLLFAYAATAVLLLPLATAPSFPVLIGVFAVLGVALGYTDTLASSSIADLYRGAAGARMMCVLHAVFGLGGVVSPLYMQAMLDAGTGWRWVYLLLAVLALIVLAATFPVARGREKTASGPLNAPAKITAADLREFFRDRNLFFLLLTTAFYTFYLSGMSVWVKRYIEVALGSPSLGTITMSLFWVGLTACRLILSVVKIPPTRYMRYSTLLSAALLLPGILSGNAVVMCVFTVLSSLMNSAVIPMALHTGCERCPRNTLLATTVIFITIYTAQILCPPLIGLIEARAGLSAGMLLCVLATSLSGLAAFGIRGKKEKA